MPRFDAPERAVYRSSTPVGGMMFSVIVGGGLWSALAIGMYAVGLI